MFDNGSNLSVPLGLLATDLTKDMITFRRFEISTYWKTPLKYFPAMCGVHNMDNSNFLFCLKNMTTPVFYFLDISSTNQFKQETKQEQELF